MSQIPLSPHYEDIPELLKDFSQIQTSRLHFRPLEMRDQQSLFAIMSDPEVSKYNRWDVHQSISQSEEYIQAALDLYAQGQYLEWAVCQEEDQLIGFFGIVWWMPDYASVELGFSLNRAYWNRGLISEALTALIHWGCDKMKLNRFEAQCEINNLASQRVLEKLGWQCEGTLRDRVYFKEAFRDMKLYSLIKRDYQNSPFWQDLSHS
ncbi:MAG: GNAT family N-acetyltransferase [Candidatus Sericytochromatia bacterium]